MAASGFRFERFSLDPTSRRLMRDDAPVELNARYFDALALMVREPGALITKDRFMGEVWRGVPVTDEALTQCIRTLRRLLGDDAADPRFIETVPKHGYRFIAPVTAVGPASAVDLPSIAWRPIGLSGVAGMVGGGAAGALGGALYGFVGVSAGMGATSALTAILCLCLLVGLIGGAGVSFGIGAARALPGCRWWWSGVGGAAGGAVVGALGRLIGLDAFTLLLGRAPTDITGGGEGLVLGAAIGLAAGLGWRRGWSMARTVAGAGVAGGVAGAAIALLGGRLMAGSLETLSRAAPDSHLSLDQIGRLVGEPAFGLVGLVATGCLEGALFGAGVVAALALGRWRAV